MKIITFFSEKGGVGKSSFSIMFSSWLKGHGVNVGLADFNERVAEYRRTEMRNRELLIRKNPDSGLKPYDVRDTWPIAKATMGEINKIKRNTGSSTPYATWLEEQIRYGQLRGLDVVVCDFPGSLTGGEFFQIVSAQMIGLIVIPTERDAMTLRSTQKMHESLSKGKWARHCVFINRARFDLKGYKSTYMKLGPKMTNEGYPMLPDMVQYSERMLTIDKVDILRSTFSFPDFEKPEFAGTKDLGLNNLFIDITRLLSSVPDYADTPPTDLSFVDGLQKTDDGKNFTGSAFPEFELKKD